MIGLEFKVTPMDITIMASTNETPSFMKKFMEFRLGDEYVPTTIFTWFASNDLTIASISGLSRAMSVYFDVIIPTVGLDGL